MELNDFLKPNDLFHPNVFYEGEWILGGEFNPEYNPNNTQGDYLLLNAKIENGKNAYQEFLEKYYFRPLQDLLNSSSMAHNFFPKIALVVDENKGKRVARFNMSVFIYEHILGLFFRKDALETFHEYIKDLDDPKDWLVHLKQLLREDRKVFFDIKNNGRKSSYFGDVYQAYLDYVRYTGSTMNFEEFLDGKISGSTKLLLAVKYYPKLFEREIPVDDLVNAFDYDTFCLVAARSAMDGCKTTEQRENLVDNCIGYVRLYLDAVKKVREENPTYDCSMKIMDNDGKVSKISIQDIEKEYAALLARHPEFTFIMLSDNEATTLLRREGVEEEKIESFDFSKKDNHSTLEAILKKIKATRELAAEWEFIRKGSREDDETSIHYPAINHSQSLSEDEKIRRMLIGREFFENSDYVYKIYGINKFQGYVGYIYYNGSVIFEKYYENAQTKKVASSSATYVMSLDNFIEMSKLSKIEIIRIIRRDSSANVKRIFHREDMDRWKSDISRAIEGSDYTEAVMNYIDTLIAHQDLKKSEVKS